MKERKISDGEGIYTIHSSGDKIEFVHPVDYLFNLSVGISMSLEKDVLKLTQPELYEKVDNHYFKKRATKDAIKHLEEIASVEIPANFIKLLSTKTKSEQEKLLRNQTLNTYQLTNLLMKAGIDFGYSFSQYIGRHEPKGIDTSNQPKLSYVEGDKVTKVGETDLSDGQLKHLIKFRKVTISKFLDRQDSWHCFYITQKSLKGEETWNSGEPHFHYLSDKFGINREETVVRLMSDNPPKSSIHIGFKRES